MKLFLTTVLCLFALMGLAQPKITFDHKTHKFPKTKEGILLEHHYPFTNSGDKPLLIEDIKVACTCTKFTFPKDAIQPNESGTIHVTFDTNKKYEWQNRILKISSNAENSPAIIRFKVMVVNEKH